jgi:ribonuclease HI
MSAHVLIYSDSKYAIKCVTEWFQRWEAKGWITVAGAEGADGAVTLAKKQVENRDLVEEVLRIIRDREKAGVKTRFEWVKGHSGDEGNEGADRLAVQGARMPEVTEWME